MCQMQALYNTMVMSLFLSVSGNITINLCVQMNYNEQRPMQLMMD